MSDDFSLQYVSKATYLAKIHMDEFITPEHILMCLLQNAEFTTKLEGLGVDINQLSSDLEEYFEEIKDSSLIADKWTPEYSSCLMDVLTNLDTFIHKGNKVVRDTQIFEALVLSNTQYISYCFENQGFNALNIIENLRSMHGLFEESIKNPFDSITDDLSNLTESEITEKLADELSQMLGIEVKPSDIRRIDVQPGEVAGRQPIAGGFIQLSPSMASGFMGGPMMQPQIPDEQEDGGKSSYIINLSENYSKDKVHYIGRNTEIDNCLDILCRLDKSNLIITGEPGVGKSSFVYGIMDKIHTIGEDDARYERINNFTFLELDLTTLVAGTSYRGELEKRIITTFKTLAKTYQNPVIVIDEFQMAFEGSKEILGVLKKYFTYRKMKFICICSSKSFVNHIQHDTEIDRRFSAIALDEPTEDECFKILRGIKGLYEEYHQVKYTKDSLDRAVAISKKYIKDKYLPDKAIDLIDEAGVLCLKLRKNKVTAEMIEQVVSKRYKIPMQNIGKTELDVVKQLEENLNNTIFGQEEAIRELTRYIKINKAGLSDDNKPIGSFLFVGPTGVGKTEVARQLANNLGVELVKFDMSEYSEKHTVTKLVGSPPSYVGYEDGGMLVSEIKKHPDCVLLLDEIEKAHPDIYNILLQIMDDAVLTDSRGMKANFNNVVLIMTSNCGAQEATKMGIGFNSGDRSNEVMKHVESTFTPEFRGRLTGTIKFNGINESMAKKILDKFIEEIRVKLLDRKASLEFSPSAVEYISNSAYDSDKGARGIKQIVDNELKTLISEEIINGNVVSNCIIRIVYNGDKLKCTIG